MRTVALCVLLIAFIGFAGAQDFIKYSPMGYSRTVRAAASFAVAPANLIWDTTYAPVPSSIGSMSFAVTTCGDSVSADTLWWSYSKTDTVNAKRLLPCSGAYGTAIVFHMRNLYRYFVKSNKPGHPIYTGVE